VGEGATVSKGKRKERGPQRRSLGIGEGVQGVPSRARSIRLPTSKRRASRKSRGENKKRRDSGKKAWAKR